MSLLSAKNLSRQFGGIKAVDGVNFELPEGEIRALIGPNGAGKSTLVSLLCGRLQPTSGTVHFKGRDITRLGAHERVQMGMAYTFQITSVFADLSCYDNVELAVQRRLTLKSKPDKQNFQDKRENGSRREYSRSALRKQTEDALGRVGLSEHSAMLAKNLSYGHQRLLEVAMGLALDPVLLMLDEPTQGLSDSEIEHFNSIIKGVAQSSTVLLIEHNMSVVMALAETITVLVDGKVLAEGSPQEIQNNDAVQQAYLGTTV